jgi:hypothetical protein
MKKTPISNLVVNENPEQYPLITDFQLMSSQLQFCREV